MVHTKLLHLTSVIAHVRVGLLAVLAHGLLVGHWLGCLPNFWSVVTVDGSLIRDKIFKVQLVIVFSMHHDGVVVHHGCRC